MLQKLTVFTCLFLIVSIAGIAQFSRGDKMAGASVGSFVFNSGTSEVTVASVGSNTERLRNYQLNINPLLGWFLSPNTAVGVTLNINPYGSTNTYEENGNTNQKDKTNGFNIGFGGFVRNYFKHTGSLMPFGQAGLNAGLSSLHAEGFFYGGSGSTIYKKTYKGSSSGGFFMNAPFTAGVTKMLGNYIGLDLYLGYLFSYTKNTFKKTTLTDLGNNGTIDETGPSETTTKFTNHGFLIGAGFQVFLQKKKN